MARQLHYLVFVMKVRKLTGKSGSGWVALTGLLSSMGAGAPAWAAPVVLDEVSLESTSEGLRIELRGDGAMPAESVNVKTDDGVVYLNVRGTRVHADRRSWTSDLGVIKAHRHHNEIELVVPTGGRTCAASPSFETTQTGLTAVLTCSPGAASTSDARRAARAAAKAAAATAATAATTAAAAAEPTETRPAKAAAATVASDEAGPARVRGERTEQKARGGGEPAAAIPDLAAVKAMVALPPEPKAELADTSKAASRQPSSAPAPTAASKTTAAGATDTTAPRAEPAATPSAEKEADSATSASAPSESHGHGLLPALLALIAGVGGAALWWKKKRGLALPKRIQIRETASLGPKRSLVVAEIDGERVILASSEAGITLLQAPAPAEATASSPIAPGLAWAAAAPSRVQAAQPQPETAGAPSILSATTALFAAPEPARPPADERDPLEDLEGAASGLARLRSLTGGLATKSPAKGAAPFAKAPMAAAAKPLAMTMPSAVANDAPSAVAMKDNDRLDDDWFDEILEDSVEDQELRAKLAAGVGGRVK